MYNNNIVFHASKHFFPVKNCKTAMIPSSTHPRLQLLLATDQGKPLEVISTKSDWTFNNHECKN